jgi:hypothetical protein
VLAVTLAASSRGADSASRRESEDVLKRAQERVLENYKNFRSVTCVETIERDYYRPRTPMLPICRQVMEERQQGLSLLRYSRDRLRLEVAISSAGEIHSWPGASRFSESSLGSLAPGPISTGPFGVLLNLIFIQDVKAFASVGELTVDGRRSLTYKFSVPANDSHFLVRSQDNKIWLVSAYDGGVRIDAESADPISLSVTTTNPPPETGVCQTMSSVQLKRTKLHDQDILLPDAAALQFLGSSGNETRSRIAFSNCRLYSSESTVNFYAEGEDAPTVRAAALTPVPAAVPDSIPFSMELRAPIDSDTAAAGDHFTATLKDSLKDGKRSIAPKGATVGGRISEVEVGFRPQQVVMFGLIPEYVDVRGVKVPLTARLDTRLQVLARERKQRRGLEFYLPEPGEWAHHFRLNGTHAVLPKGFVSEWVTTYARPIKDSVP